MDRTFRGNRVNITVLPKGTLLFRGIRTADKVREDVLGIDKGEAGYCLNPYYNVFFYPFPFVDVSIGHFSHLVLYVVAHDIQLVNLISPSPMAREDRYRTGAPIVSCDKIPRGIHGCGLEGRKYDPCFSTEFLNENLDVTGMIAIANADRESLMRKLASRSEESEMMRDAHGKYYAMYLDRNGPGIPEIILYPRVLREKTDVSAPRNTVLQQWCTENQGSLAYFPWVIVSRDDARILDVMTRLTSATGYREKRALIDKRTGFYVREDIASSETLPYLVENKTDTKWNIEKTFPEFRFNHARTDITKDEVIKLIVPLQEKIQKYLAPPLDLRYADHVAIVLAEVLGRFIVGAAGCHYEMTPGDPEQDFGEDYTDHGAIETITKDTLKKAVDTYQSTWAKEGSETPAPVSEDDPVFDTWLWCSDDRLMAWLYGAVQDSLYTGMLAATKDPKRLSRLASIIGSNVVSDILLSQYESLMSSDVTSFYIREVLTLRIEQIVRDLVNEGDYGSNLVDDIVERRRETIWKDTEGYTESEGSEAEASGTEGETAKTEGETSETEGEPAKTEGEPAKTEGGRRHRKTRRRARLSTTKTHRRRLR